MGCGGREWGQKTTKAPQFTRACPHLGCKDQWAAIRARTRSKGYVSAVAVAPAAEPAAKRMEMAESGPKVSASANATSYIEKDV
jgi:hypothetical protein